MLGRLPSTGGSRRGGWARRVRARGDAWESLSIATFSKNGGAVTVSGGAGDGGDIGMPSSDVAEERAPPNEVFGGVFGVEEMAIDACRLPANEVAER